MSGSIYGVIVILIYDITSKIIKSVAYLLYHFDVDIPNLDFSWDGGVVHITFGYFDLVIDFRPHF